MEIKKVIIGKGEMPKNCRECRFISEWGECPVLNNNDTIDYDEYEHGRDPACPLEEEDE